jgi:tight adherence protein B
MMALVPLAIGFVTVLLLGWGYLRVRRAERETEKILERKLRMVARKPTVDSGDGFSQLDRWYQLADRLPENLRRRFARADVALDLHQVGVAIVAVVAIAAAALYFVGWPMALSVVAGFLVVAMMVFELIMRQRVAAFVDGLPGFFDATRQLLAVGNSLQTAITKAIDNSGPELRRYLVPLDRRLQNSAPLGESVIWLARRLDIEELHMFAVAVQTNLRYGGRMTHVLSDLSAMLRDRRRVGREMKAATAETRYSAGILVLWPFAIAGLIFLVNPTAVEFFFTTDLGQTLILVAFGLQFVGTMIMLRMIRVDF